MMNKPATIAKRSDFIRIEELENHPKVTRILPMPYDYLLVDFWDDWFRQIFNPKIKYHQDPLLREKAAELRLESDALIKPLMDRSTDMNFVSGMGWQINGKAYDFRMLRKERIIDVKLFSNVPSAAVFEVGLVFSKSDEKKTKNLSKVVDDWRTWALDKSLLREASLAENDRVIVEPLEGIEDALAALIVMLRDTRGKTGITKVEFRPCGNTDTL